MMKPLASGTRFNPPPRRTSRGKSRRFISVSPRVEKQPRGDESISSLRF